MLRHVTFVRNDVSEQCIASIIRVTRLCELETTLGVTSNPRIVFPRSVLRLLITVKVHSSPILISLIKEAILSSETSVFTRAIRRNMPEDDILHNLFIIFVTFLPVKTYSLKLFENI
jgi:hypothetical protein